MQVHQANKLCRLLKQLSKMKQQMRLPTGIYLAPMVRGSELAFRMLARRHGNASLCYSPMLRDHDVISVAAKSDQFTSKELKIDKAGRSDLIEETAYLLMHDAHPVDTANLAVQLCGNCPATLAQATTAVLDIYTNKNKIPPAGIDLNLGCPQECADKGHFGSFLVEKNPDAAVSCISSMRYAIDAHSYCKRNDIKPRLSAKIRLLDSVDDTIKFVRRLQSAGIDYVAIHCRQRTDKHRGEANWEAGGEIVAAFSPEMPIVLNGGIFHHKDAEMVMEQTKCHAVMAATGYLGNHRLFQTSPTPESLKPELVALEYLDLAEQYPPPNYLYIQKHLRWIFRETLQPENEESFDKKNYKDWRVRIWSFLVRPYIRSIEQFRMFVALYVQLSSSGEDEQVPESIRSLVKDVTFGSVKKAGKRKRD